MSARVHQPRTTDAVRVDLPMQTHQPFLFRQVAHRPQLVLVGLAAVLLPLPAAAAEGRTGEQIYRQRCAKCHGAAGEGTTEHYPQPLVGDRSVAALARRIARTMPEDAPGTCVGAEAETVAAYIHDAFYSPAAQVRNQPPRLEL